jgi:hypothetical protein
LRQCPRRKTKQQRQKQAVHPDILAVSAAGYGYNSGLNPTFELS